MPPSKMAKILNSPARNFKESWKSGNSWLRYETKSKSMFCDICIKAQKSNSFTTGCTILKKENVTKHSTNKEHLAAVSSAKQSINMMLARQTALNKSEAAVTSALVNTYFAAKHNLASSLVPELNELVLYQGVSHLAYLKVDNHTTYGHSTSVNDFQQAIAAVLEDDMLCKVSRSEKFSLMFDESTDISVHQNLIIYIRILESDALGYFEPHTYFLGIDSLARANADSIYEKVTGILAQKGININNLSGLSTDGAAVMLGNKSGVVKRLKENAQGVLSTHCIAHRLALSCCTGADSIPYMVKIQEILNSVFKYFHFSPKNMAMLEGIQSLSNGQSSRFKQVFHTRWLSFEGSVDALVSNYSSLVSVFLEEKSGKSLSMHKSITCFKFLYVAHFLSDVLKPLSILSKMYQKNNIDFSEVIPLLSSTISTLEDLRDSKSGVRLNSFLSKVTSEPQTDSDGLVTFQFEGHTIRDSSKQRSEADSVCHQFVTGMVKSLNERFSDNYDSSILTSLSNVFNPSLCQSVKADDIDVVSDYLGTVGIEGYHDDLHSFVSFAHSQSTGNKSVSSSRDVMNLAIKHKDVYPAAAEAAERLLVAPVSTVDCERGFSRQNIIKTCLRNSMSIGSLDSLMRISIDGPCNENFDFKAAFQKWAGAKTRRILKK